MGVQKSEAASSVAKLRRRKNDFFIDLKGGNFMGNSFILQSA
jgi:hypothetical protein